MYQSFYFSNINVILFTIIPLGRYTPMETLFPLLVTALEVFNQYVLQHVRCTLLDVLKTLEMTSYEDIFNFGCHDGASICPQYLVSREWSFF